MPDTVTLTVNGHVVDVDGTGASLLDVLRDQLGINSPKDGCSPQGPVSYTHLTLPTILRV